MNDCTPQDSARITTSSDVIADLHDEIERLERELDVLAAQHQDPSPQAQTLEEAARDVGKWLNERPNRPLDLRSVAMLVAAVQPISREPLSDLQIAELCRQTRINVMFMTPEDIERARAFVRAIESHHGITVGKEQR